MKKKRSNKRGMALSQILILLIGTIAISYAFSSEVKEISAYDPPTTDVTRDCRTDEGCSGGRKCNSIGVCVECLTNDDCKGDNKECRGEICIDKERQFSLSNTLGVVSAGESAFSIIKDIKQDTKPAEGGKDTKDNTQNIISKEPGLLSSIFGFGGGNKTLTNGEVVDSIVSTFAWAGTVYTIIKAFSFFTDEDDLVNSIALGASTGVLAYRGVSTLFGEGGAGGALGSWMPTWGSVGIGAGVAVGVFLATYKDEETKRVSFECYPWDAPTGGQYCEECNKQGLPCSEYQCRSLGQACEITNPGTSEQKCIWKNRNDVNPPVIQPWEYVLPDGFKYVPDNAISPPDRGVIIKSDERDGCVKAFTPIAFGIITSNEESEPEATRCKIDFIRKNFSAMQFYFGGSSLFMYNHTQGINLPGPSSLESENITIKNDGNYVLYVKCEDVNGNSNVEDFVFKYCVQKGPDTTPPIISGTNLLNGMPIAYNQSSVDIEVYTNEPSTCRWSHLDKEYADMEEEMSCASKVFQMNAKMVYKCSTTLTGLKNDFKNDFYFRCKDQPYAAENDRNTNQESYKFSLIGTTPLMIDSVGPNGTMRDSTNEIKVTLTAKTSAGFKEGEAICEYSESCYLEDGSKENFVDKFYNTGGFEHSQELWIGEGEYECVIRCIDLGGNSDTKTTSYAVEIDTTAPTIVRAYRDDEYLKIITNEDADCVYGIDDCNYLFSDGIKMNKLEDTDHYTTWDSKKTLYIKCADVYGNRPIPDNQCSIIVKPFEISYD